MVTLVADEQALALDECEVNIIVDAYRHQGAFVEDVICLSPNKAYDMILSNMVMDDAKEMLQHLLQHVPIDTAVMAQEDRRKKLLICDMDSTMIEQECIDELADQLGLKEKVAAITEQAMCGKLDFAQALEARVAMLEGLTEEQLQEVYDQAITIMPGAKTLLATMKQHDAYTVLVSGGFSFFTNRVKQALGFDVDESNILVIEDGKLTGKVKHPILDKEAKLNSLHYHSTQMGISEKQVVAVGDGANDLPMLQAAGMGVAYHAKPAVQQAASYRVNHNDLTTLLYFQGYSESEICFT